MGVDIQYAHAYTSELKSMEDFEFFQHVAGLCASGRINEAMLHMPLNLPRGVQAKDLCITQVGACHCSQSGSLHVHVAGPHQAELCGSCHRLQHHAGAPTPSPANLGPCCTCCPLTPELLKATQPALALSLSR